MNLGKPALKSVYANASLTTRFAIHSLICVGIMTIALWFIVSNYLISQILDREWRTTAQIVRADVRKFLVEYDFKAQDRKSVGPKFAALLDHMRLEPEIIRFRVYNPKAIVIWSDNKQLVGKYFGDNPQLQKALRGNVIADMGERQQSDNAVDGKAASPVVEVYVPIYGENGGELLGVFETYRRPDRSSKLSMRRDWWFSWVLWVAVCCCMFHSSRSCAEPRGKSPNNKSTCSRCKPSWPPRSAWHWWVKWRPPWLTVSVTRCRRSAPQLRSLCSTLRALTDLNKTARREKIYGASCSKSTGCKNACRVC